MSLPRSSGLALRAPNDDPNVITLPTQAERVQHRTVLGGLTSAYQQAARKARSHCRPGFRPAQAGTGGVPGADRLTDRQAADAVRGRIDWKYALGMERTDPGFESPRSRGSGRAWLSTAWSMRCWV